MKRREFLLAMGAAVSFDLAGSRIRPSTDALSVGLWFSESAAVHADVRERAAGYLGQALEDVDGAVRLSVGGTVTLPAEEGRDVLAETWPRMVIEGFVGGGEVNHVSDVNLLVTDGDPRTTPAGHALRGIAAVTGARYLARMPPADRTPLTVEYSVPTVVAQLLVHECGHALGLTHRHGTITVDGDAVVSSPMVSGYAWASDAVRERRLDHEVSACGRPYPPVDGKGRRLSLRYSPCARRAARRSRATSLR